MTSTPSKNPTTTVIATTSTTTTPSTTSTSTTTTPKPTTTTKLTTTPPTTTSTTTSLPSTVTTNISTTIITETGSGGSSNAAAIAGGVVGSLIGVLIVFLIIIIYRRKSFHIPCRPTKRRRTDGDAGEIIKSKSTDKLDPATDRNKPENDNPNKIENHYLSIRSPKDTYKISAYENVPGSKQDKPFPEETYENTTFSNEGVTAGNDNRARLPSAESTGYRNIGSDGLSNEYSYADLSIISEKEQTIPSNNSEFPLDDNQYLVFEAPKPAEAERDESYFVLENTVQSQNKKENGPRENVKSGSKDPKLNPQITNMRGKPKRNKEENNAYYSNYTKPQTYSNIQVNETRPVTLTIRNDKVLTRNTSEEDHIYESPD